MRSLLVLALLVVASPTAAQTSWVPAATYLNDPAHEAQAAVLRAQLDAAGLRSVTTCSAGCTLSVESPRWLAALTLMRTIVAREHLDIDVTVPATS